MGREIAYQGFRDIQDFAENLYGVSNLSQTAEALIAEDRDGQQAIRCPDGKMHRLELREEEGKQVFAIQEAEAQAPVRSFRDNLRSILGVGESREQFRQKHDAWNQALSAGQSLLNGGIVPLDFSVSRRVKPEAAPSPPAPSVIRDDEAEHRQSFQQKNRYYALVEKANKDPNPYIKGTTASVNQALNSLYLSATRLSLGKDSSGDLEESLQTVAAFHLIHSSEESRASFLNMAQHEGENSPNPLQDWAITHVPETITQVLPVGKDACANFLYDCSKSGGTLLMQTVKQKLLKVETPEKTVKSSKPQKNLTAPQVEKSDTL